MIRYFAEHPTAANILMLVIIILGLIGLPKLQRDTFPVIPPTEIEIRTPYPGATPDEVEEAICFRIEDALDSIAELVEVRCDARENLAITTVQMHEQGNIDTFYNDIKSQIDLITGFPDKVEVSTVAKLERTAVVASIAITGKMSAVHLKAYANKVKQHLKFDPQIAQVKLLGFSEQDIIINIAAETLRRYNLSITDIIELLERQSFDLPSGIMETATQDFIVRLAEQRRTRQEFADLVIISSPAGGQVRLGDIAVITSQFKKQEDQILFNGQRAALLEISKTTSQDALQVKKVILQHLEREKRTAPQGISLEISQDVTSVIRDRLRILISNGIQGLFLVFLTMWLFFSFRYSFWVTMGLPVSFLGAIFAMQLLGYTLNMITLVALLVAIGLLMDDAIVLSENVATQLRKGKNKIDAVVTGVTQVAPGVFSSFLTTVIIIGPLAYMAGKMGAILSYLPVVLIVTLAVSLVEAFLILPSHLLHSSGQLVTTQRSTIHQWFDKKFTFLRDELFAPLAKKTIALPYLTLGIILGLVIIAYASLPSGLLKYRALPNLESNVIQARILLPQGTPFERTEEVVQQVVSALKTLDDEFSALQDKKQGKQNRLVKNIIVLFNTNKDAYESGAHLATISADLLPAEQRVGSIDSMLNRWRELTGVPADVITLKFTDRERGVAGKAIDIRLQGNKLEQLKQASQDLQQWLSQFKGVQDLSDDLRPGKPELQISLKKSAGSFGITAKAVADSVRAALHGGTKLEVQSGYEAEDVIARLDVDDRDSLEDLHYLMVRNNQGQLVPLSAVAEIKKTRGFSRIHRVNGQKTVTVQGTINTDIINARQLMQMTKKQFLPTLKEKYPGVRPAFQGQGKESALTGNSLQFNVFLGLLGVYFMLAFQFKSFAQPLAVILAIPTSLIGVVGGHLLLGLDISMPSLVGMATLIGIVVNDSILLLMSVKNGLKKGMTIVAAAQNASIKRFRAIILTSLTTIAGLTPLLFETSTQAQFLIPLVASLVFGLLSTTLFSLFLVPAV
ncbi:MAG: efflux RND transporter permease subunit, partial [Gammaproteobacteria bacterium]|nr:efflux RND transporter permease subunit [Gammaproteobacteria bacterium]